MTDYLCPNCGPITEGDIDANEEMELCAVCGVSEEDMTPLVSAYRKLQSQLAIANGRVDDLERALYHGGPF